jgi:hypothetical protein
MLADVMMGSAIQLEIGSASSMYSEIIQLIQARQCSVICIAHLPPNAPHKARYLTRRLRAALPALRIIIGRWAPTTLANDGESSILEAGADHVCSTLEETRLYLCQLGGLQLSAAGVNDANA